MATYVGLAAGILAGFAHATMLWRTARRLTVWTPLWGLLRLAIVAAVLIVAAISGVILSAAAGWVIGFALLGAPLALRQTSRAIGSPTMCSSE